MVLEIYRPKKQNDGCIVTITPKAFRFNTVARKLAQLDEINWMRIYFDNDDRLVVFEPVPGDDRPIDALKLSTTGKSSKHVTAKRVISNTPWIKILVEQPVEVRRFEMKEYHRKLPLLEEPSANSRMTPWYIKLMPAFEKSIIPSKINDLGSIKGIYRYRGGSDGEEIVYIGKGNIKDRFLQESGRQDWGVTRIEYSIVQDDKLSHQWEAWWIKRFKQENNGRRPSFNMKDGHKVDSDAT